MGILATVVLVAVKSAKARAKDVKRKAEMASISRAIDAYYTDKGEYAISNPDSTNCESENKGKDEPLMNNSCASRKYAFDNVPTDFSNNYQYRSDGSYYILWAFLESGERFAITSPHGQLLVLVNEDSSESKEVAEYYIKKRSISGGDIVYLHTSTDEHITWNEYVTTIREPLKDFITTRGLENQILYIVPTYGIPTSVLQDKNSSFIPSHEELYTSNSAYYYTFHAVDSFLAGLKKDLENKRISNPYRNSHKNINSSYGIYIVSRLDGPSPEIAKGLVDKAIYGEEYVNKDYGVGYNTPGPNSTFTEHSVCYILNNAGYPCTDAPSPSNECAPIHPYDGSPDNTPFLWHYGGCHWYCENTANWKPGAIAYQFRSFTARGTIRAKEGQFLPNALLAGVTATSGAVGEPYVDGIVQQNTFFLSFIRDHFNFGESIYQSLYVLNWEATVVGDPLYKLTDNSNIDNSAPKITNLKYKYSDNQATISWENATSDSGSPEITIGSVTINENTIYDTSIVRGASLLTAKNYFAQHKITLTDLSGSNYDLKVTATDPAGNKTEKTFQIAPSGGYVNVP